MHQIELTSPPIENILLHLSEHLFSYPNGLVTKGVRITEGLLYEHLTPPPTHIIHTPQDFIIENDELKPEEFVTKFREEFPLHVRVCKGYYGTSNRTSVSEGDSFNIHFIKNTKVCVPSLSPFVIAVEVMLHLLAGTKFGNFTSNIFHLRSNGEGSCHISF